MKSCETCIHVLYHPNNQCKGCAKIVGEEKDGPNTRYLFEYPNYVEGDAVKARVEAERRGDCNIVIGGSGEHEVNAKWLMSEAYEKLANTCEQVGGVVTHKGNYRLELTKPYEPYYWHLEWMDGKFYRIMRVTEKEWWVID